MSGVTFRAEGVERLREAIAYGMLNLGLAIENDAKADAVVRGGHRSFAPNGPVGGNLRRSYHAVAFLDGRQIGGDRTDENKRPVPQYSPGRGIRVFIGTNAGYGAYVELGTSRMAARPTLVPALLKNRARATQLIGAGARKHMAVR